MKIFHAFLIIIFLSACAMPALEMERARQHDLIKTCINKHGSPVVEDGRFKSCEFRGILKRE